MRDFWTAERRKIGLRSSLWRDRLRRGGLADKLLRRQPVRFLIAGGFATLINWGSRFPLSLVLPFEAAIATAYGIGMIAGFVLYRQWVFHGSQLRLRHQLGRFLLVNAVGLGIVLAATPGILLLLAATNVLSLPVSQAFAHAGALVLATGVNFVGHRLVTFARGHRISPIASGGTVAAPAHEPPAEPDRSGQAKRASPRPLMSAAVALGLGIVVLSQRLILWRLYRGDIVRTIDANRDWLTWQFLPLPAYTDHLIDSLYYLQQTPPLPHVVLGIILKLASWPLHTAETLFALQAAISIATTIVLFLLLRRIGCYLVIATLLAGWFGLSTDLYVLEIDSFGQLFYESGGMLLVTITAWLVCDTATKSDRGRPRARAIAAGIVASLAALTRASLTFLAAPIAVIVGFRRGWRSAVMVMVPVFLLQGAWCLKNSIVYGSATIATSSWSGLNSANGINVSNGYGQPGGYDPAPLTDFILSEPALGPEWLRHLLRDHGYVGWDSEFLPGYIPTNIRDFDDRVQSRLDGTNPSTNSLATATLSREYGKVAMAYTLADPAKFLRKIEIGLHIFWQPIASFTAMYVAPISVDGVERGLISGPYLRRRETVYARDGSRGGGSPERITPPTISLYLLDTISIFVLFALLPIMIMFDVKSRFQRREPVLDADLWALIVIAGYGIGVSTAVDLGENMRFRLSFEPVIIALTAGVLVTLTRRCRPIWNQLQEAIAFRLTPAASVRQNVEIAPPRRSSAIACDNYPV